MPEFSLRRHVAVAPDVVWRAWTTREGLATWWWPQLPDTTYEIDPHVGGHYLFESKAAGFGVRGEFTVVNAPLRLEMTWYWIGGDTQEVPDRVQVELRPDGDGTSVTVTHQVNQLGDSGDGLRQGWGDVLDRLALLKG
ncbi:MAG TPA: SRPBCC domain-containing protein [Flexivirga sp.]|uniref:SRPBCC family protein n=1 Tax=Flexivirga sp. TaxID=1962927 RepID=UPI002C0E567C|nr:SRPBCC domain-containing protein [Flexivirga sp.]HWC23096.1 SRPBCC domain-containing protein [Flexivirga sp.]